ncbi:MAG: tetratricopeptide repeat protein [Oligoflexia bacterium]|nr:tetratricopeptide repeat protein [Oligoflexia bacterium]
MKPLVLMILFLFSSTLMATDEKSLSQLEADLAKIEKSIEVTRVKMKEIRDVAFLPDLYFVLAELHVDKSRYLYTINRQKNKDAPINELDFSDSLKAKKQAIEVYQRFIETFPKHASLDKAYFFMAHEFRETGNFEEMIKNYMKITNEFKQSSFWEETQLILGDYFLENKKDPKMAQDFYQKILERPQNPFMPLARYKLGWCQINQEKFHEALLSFESVITIDSKISLEKLPDIYKKSDVKRDALLAMVWPYSEEKKYEPFRANALEYFERLSPNRPTLLKVLTRLSKRLMIKEKIEMALPVYFRLVEITNELESKTEAIDKFYQAFRRSKKQWPIEDVPQELVATLLRVRNSDFLKAPEKAKIEKNYEIYLRDFSTRLHKKAKFTKKEDDFLNAVNAYEAYLFAYPKAKYSSAILLNLAESYFALKKYARAGYKYEELTKRIRKSKNIQDSAIQAYALALKNPEKISKLELTESREGFRAIGMTFIKAYRGDKANPMILFNIARTFYDERDFDKAVIYFNKFISVYPTHKEVTTAGNLILDSYNQREDYEGLIKAGKMLIANRRLNNSQFKSDVAEIIKQAEYRKIQNATGDPRSRGYAQKLLAFASKYKGSSLGDQALYEAFVSLKAKKDPQAYDPGEQLLIKHSDSKYAKEVVGAMGQMALNTADYRRAAKYFEIYSRKYPKDPSSSSLLRNAAQMREYMGDFKEAADNYRTLNEIENVAKQYIMAQNWSSAAQTLSARNNGSLKSNYWLGLSLFRQSNISQAKSYLTKAAKSRASSYEDKSMAAHSLYLIAAEALNDFKKIQLGSGQKEDQLVKIKSNKLNQLTNQFNQVIGYGNGRWTIAALYELGRAHNEFAQFILNASIPAGLDANQQAQYKQLISQQSNQYRQKAKSFFNTCVSNAKKFEVFTQFVKGCQSQGEQIIDEAVEERINAKASDSYPGEATAIRKALFDTPRDTRLLMQLAQAYYRVQDYSMSRLILSRVLEIKPNLAEAEALIGKNFQGMNDLESAKLSYKTALKKDRRNQTALEGLASLRKQFGF